MGSTLEGYKGIVMCNRYECPLCGYVFYWPINNNTDATSAVSIPVCPNCNKINGGR